jgi:hypothetical protein
MKKFLLSVFLALFTGSAFAVPSVPSGLAAVAVSSSQINLRWNAAYGGVKYQIYVNDIFLTETTQTSFQHIGLPPGTTYNYRVSASEGGSTAIASPWTVPAVTASTRAIRWYAFAILMSTVEAPTLFNFYNAVPLPVSYATETECNGTRDWLYTQLAGTPAPGGLDNQQIFVCGKL